MRRALVAVLLLAGCPPPKPAERPYPAPSAKELVDALRARAKLLGSLRADTRVDHMGANGERAKVSMSFLVARGGKLRIEAEGPMGPLATLVSDGAKFALLDVRNSQYLNGPADACNVARLIRVALPPEAVVDVLSGAAPLDGEPASVSWDASSGGREVLELRAPDGGREVLKLDGRERRWDVLSAERTDAGGRVLWRVTHEGFADRGQGARLPERTFLDEPPQKADARIRFLAREVNPALPDGIFTLAAPAGIAQRYVDCNTP
jgi:hypothetical protein